jgi:hypothetical protein
MHQIIQKLLTDKKYAYNVNVYPFKLCACLVANDICIVGSTEYMYKETRCVVCHVAHKPTDWGGGGGRCPLV